MGKFTQEDDALLAELGVEVQQKKPAKRTPREERVVAGFEEIQRFVEANGRVPRQSEGCDIFERLYAVRLDRIRKQEECRSLLAPLDHQELLVDPPEAARAVSDDMDDDALLAELGVEADVPDIARLRHVRPSVQKRTADEIAARRTCKDFETFRPLFEQVQEALDAGTRETKPFRDEATIESGQFFILSGQKAYVATKDKAFRNAQGRIDARLRVIFDNGTESNMLMRSLERALQKDETGRRIVDASMGPLFARDISGGDTDSGTIYVLRSNADITFVTENRNLIHKIGVTSGRVETRIARARLDPTFLMAEVEIVATYRLYNINCVKLENLIHRVFAPARLEIEIRDRFGNPVVPHEWFMAPLDAINEAVKMIRDGTITRYAYDPAAACLVLRPNEVLSDD
ncbi:MAG: GIY-YIG nuclease family protein [Gammaproteobacteria bacterium]|nr:GIY-YIG nuclease family protein [Gammaproteobacteria bacterium]